MFDCVCIITRLCTFVKEKLSFSRDFLCVGERHTPDPKKDFPLRRDATGFTPPQR